MLQLAEAALELPETERRSWLAREVAPHLVARVLELCASAEEMTADTDLGVAVRVRGRDQDRSGAYLNGYRLIGIIGEGAMGQVYRAMSPSDGQPVALKLLREAHLDVSARPRFEREQKLLARLRHPNIAQLLDAGTTDDGHPYVVMELVDGPRLDLHAKSLDLAGNLRLFVAVSAAVMYAHRARVIHRDLKPGNILVTRSGQPKLLDFGIAKSLLDASPNPHTAAKLHTPAYASPEQLRGEALDEATDIYSLGVILYQIVTGSLPFAPRSSPVRFAQTVISELPELPSVRGRARGRSEIASPGLDRIAARALAKTKVDRYPTVEAMVEDVRAVLFGD